MGKPVSQWFIGCTEGYKKKQIAKKITINNGKMHKNRENIL